jgi:uncharacterized protein (TIGR03790 family)
MKRPVAILYLLLLALTAWPAVVAGQSGDNVLLVANSLSPISEEIADYYATKRSVPRDQILRLSLPPDEDIARSTYIEKISNPITAWLVNHDAADRILYLVVTKDVPLRIRGTGGPNGTVASVDSELTGLYRKLYGQVDPVVGSIKNSYFVGDGLVTDAKPFSHRISDLYLVARLDGYTVADIKALIDRGAAPTQEGVVLLDARLELARSAGNTWLINAAAALNKLPGWNGRVVLDTSAKVVRDQKGVLGYYSWGSNDPANNLRHQNNQFVPGALAAEFVSTDARTFREPPSDWVVNDPSQPFRGSHQSLIGDLIRDGITGVAGHVAEPYLNATIRPEILFPAYVSGFSLVEAFYLSMPAVSWQTVVVGDPLCAPFRTKVVAASDLDPGIDPVTELPVFLSDRRVAALTKPGVKAEAAKLMAKAEARLIRKDQAAAQQALEQATAIDEGFVEAHMALAVLYGTAGKPDAAADQYRRVLAHSPNDVAALNDLAYLTAVELKAPNDALPLAKRAFATPNAPAAIADTLAWIYHLMGNDAEALPIITTAVAQRPAAPEIYVHAATIFEAIGNFGAATGALDLAVRLDDGLADRNDIKELRERLGVRKP